MARSASCWKRGSPRRKSSWGIPARGGPPCYIEIVSQDTFLLDQLDLRPADVIDALRRQVSRYHRELRSVEALLTILGSPGSGCPDFAQACHQLL